MSAPFELPGYEILEKLGEGGMSTVWKARQLSLDRLVAIKALAAEYLPSEEAWQRFQIEARAAARLSHPGLVQVFDAGAAAGQPYIVMEYVAGPTVGDLIRQYQRLPEKDALPMARAIAVALGYAWDKDCIIHCDIKPDNLLVAPDGSVKVVDLGLARFIGMHRRVLEETNIYGTPNYTSPEQAEGLPDLDCRADIYSLGATLYHLVTGRLPFGDSPGNSAMDRHRDDFLPDPLELNPGLSAGAAWLIEKMMVKDRAFRTPYWSNVLEDIGEVLAGRFPREPLPQPGQSTVLRSPRRPVPHEAGPRKKRIESPAPLPRRKIVVSEDVESYSPVRRARSSGWGGRIIRLLLLAALGGGAYVYFFTDVPDRHGFRLPLQFRAPPAPPAPPEPEPAPATAAPEEAPPVAAPAPDWTGPGADPSARVGAPAWDDRQFQRGARAYNEAIALFKDYQKTREDPEVLRQIESLAREAVRAFEECSALAPPGSGMDEHIRNASRLISDVRQSTLMDHTEAPRREENVRPLPAPESSLAPAARTGARTGLALSPLWNKMPLGPRPLWEDLRKLLAPHGAAGIQLDPQPGLFLVGQVTYLMPAIEAAKALGASLGSKRPIETPGFPDRSFSHYALRGNFGDGFEIAHLVVDGADRVAAVQLSREKPAPIALEPDHFNADWRAYNFVLGRVKGRREWRIGHRVRAADGIVLVESELAEPDPVQVYGLGASKERVALYLAQPVVNLVLARLENVR